MEKGRQDGKETSTYILRDFYSKTITITFFRILNFLS